MYALCLPVAIYSYMILAAMAGLSLVQLFGRHEVFQVLVICPDLAFVFRTFNEVPPLLESLDDRQHFLVMNLVVPFDWS